jgi:hypothetical protein
LFYYKLKYKNKIVTIFGFRHDSVADCEKSEEFLHLQISPSDVVQQIFVVELERRFEHRVRRKVDFAANLFLSTMKIV